MIRITIEVVCDDDDAMEVERAFKPLIIDADKYIYKRERIKENKDE